MLVIGRSLLDVIQEKGFAVELLRANSAPILVGIVCLFAVLHRGGRSSARAYRLISARLVMKCRQLYGRCAAFLYFLPWAGVVFDLVKEWAA